MRFALGAGRRWLLAAVVDARLRSLCSLACPRLRSPSAPAKVELGKKLWFDPRLSRSGFISCNSCHNLSMGGSDNLKTSIGDKWQKGPINSPTVLNVQPEPGAGSWTAAPGASSAGGPIANPGEMAFSHDLAVDMLRSAAAVRGRVQAQVWPDKLGIDRSGRHRRLLPGRRCRRGGLTAWLKGAKGHPGRSCVATSCSGARAAWPATMAPTSPPPRRRRGRSRRWAWSARRTTLAVRGRSAVTGSDAERFRAV